MKHFVLLLFFLSFCELLFSTPQALDKDILAEKHPKNGKVRYDGHLGEVRLNLYGEINIVDIGGIFSHRKPFHYCLGTMAEYRVGRCLSLGLGADYYGLRRLDYKEFGKRNYLNCVPIYANVRFITTGHVKFFAELRAGYAIPINQVSIKQNSYNEPYRSIKASGFFTGSGIGLSYYGHSIGIGFNNVDIHDANTQQSVLHDGSNRKVIATDFYLRYSYSFALN